MYLLKMFRMAKAALRLSLAAGFAAMVPGEAWACSSCMIGDPKTASTYFGMTLMMSSLPLMLIGGLGYWLYRHHS
jgi:hypothetical protein